MNKLQNIVTYFIILPCMIIGFIGLVYGVLWLFSILFDYLKEVI